MSEEKKKEILEKELDAKQLESISGGSFCYESAFYASGSGSCSGAFFQERCAATVEKGSQCFLSNDYCGAVWNQYTVEDPKTFKEKYPED